MRSLLRLPLRQSRFLHSPSAYRRRAPERTALVLGVSLAVAGYTGWRIAGPDQRIALDALPKQSPQMAKASNSRPEETEPDATFPSAPEHPIKQKPMRVENAVEEESTRHPQGDKSTGYPSNSTSHAVAQNGNAESGPEDGVAEGEEGEGAFDPVTGQINWDCPCLGGMAHGPCGPQFREAFSCFIYSEQEPKGIDCVEKFKNMQDCFREHPDIYGEEIADDDEDDGSDQHPDASQIATKETSETSPPTPDTPSRRSVNIKDRRSRENQ